MAAKLHPSIVYGTISATIRVTDRYGHQHTLSRDGFGPNGLHIVCKLIGDRFVFSGGTKGEHCIDADKSITSPERLLAHWAGYCTNNGLKDWEVLKIALTGEAYYRYSVEGYNWCSQESFTWRLRDLDDDRFDLSRVVVPELPLAYQRDEVRS